MYRLEIENAGIQKVTAHAIRAQSIELGPASVDEAKARKLELSIFPKQLALRGVKADVDLHFDLDIGVDVEINLGFKKIPWKDTKTISFPVKFSPHGLRDLVIDRDVSSSDRLSLSLEEVGLGAITAGLDAIAGSQLGALVTEAIIENVAAGRIELPAGGFQLDGLGLGSMAVRDLLLSGLRVDRATIGSVSGAMPLPRLEMKNFKLERKSCASSTGLKMADSALHLTLADEQHEIVLTTVHAGWLTLTPKVWGGITLTFAELSLTDPEIEGAIGAIELRGLDMPVKARNLELAPIEGERASIGAIEVAPASVAVSPLFGGTGGSPFKDSAQEVKRLAQIVVRAADQIDGLQAIYEMKDGSVQPGAPHGGSGGSPSSFTLNPGEHIVRMDGQHNGILNRLRFHTDQGRVAAFGRYKDLYIEIDIKLPLGPSIHKKIDVQPGQDISVAMPAPLPALHLHVPADVAPGSWLEVGGKKFEVKARNTFEFAAHEVVGFHGRSGAMMDAIGVLYV
jgi:hypothetical protein